LVTQLEVLEPYRALVTLPEVLEPYQVLVAAQLEVLLAFPNHLLLKVVVYL
jgi:hypothetical protein